MSLAERSVPEEMAQRIVSGFEGTLRNSRANARAPAKVR